MTNKQKQLLEIMKKDIVISKEFYKPSKILWQQISNQFEAILVSEGISDVQSQKYNNSFSLFEITNKIYFGFALWLLYQNIKMKDKFSLLEKTKALLPSNNNLSFNANLIKGRPLYDDKYLTWDYLISLDTILSIAEIYPAIITDSCVVADLGAGWGRIGYLLLQINKKISYNIFDIPHILLISQEYLKDKINANVYEYEKNRNILNFDKDFLLNEPGIRFHLSCNLEKFSDKSIDVFINVASFQEMSLGQVVSYFNIIDKKSIYFYTQQRYEALEMNHSKYPYMEKWDKLFDRDITFYPLWFESMFKC